MTSQLDIMRAADHHLAVSAQANLHGRLSPNGAAAAKIAKQCDKTKGIDKHYG